MGVHTWGMQKNSKVLTIHLYGFFPTIGTPAQLWDPIHLISLELFNTIYVKLLTPPSLNKCVITIKRKK